MPVTGRLLIPSLAGIYAKLAGPSIFVLRVIAGIALMVHGYGKITNPFGNVGFVESLGFVPGVVWSPLLAAGEFFGGLLLAIGLLTRPAALVGMIILLVTVWFHWVLQSEGYAGAEKSLLWAAICFYFVAHGGQSGSVDRALAREV
jgi:putative oxidoreductase